MIPFPTAVDEQSWAGATWPLGATYDPATSTTTFAVHAPAATRVVVEIYSWAYGHDRYGEAVMVKGGDGIWRAKLSNVGIGAQYGYRAWGECWPYDEAWERGGSSAGYVSEFDSAGNRFNPNKLMFDPYAREVSHTLLDDGLLAALAGKGLDGGVFGTGGGDCGGRPRREVDTGPWAPKGIVVADDSPTGTRPRLAPENAFVYEAHVKGMTAHPSSSSLKQILSGTAGFEDVVDVPAALRGTYAGAAYLAPYLRALGITTIELLPVHLTNSSPSAAKSGTANYWGYQTLSFFAPNRDYAHDQEPGGPTREVKAMVKAFHDAGLEVYLDVVYNHTAEGGHWGGDVDTVGFSSLGGLATADYYVMTGDNRLVDGATGCSNQLNHSSSATQRLVLDSLAYWADAMGVDGFRFDLAPVLGRKPADAERDDWGNQKRFFSDHPLLVGIRELAQQRELEVVAEAWDLWGYEVGNFPDGWAEWNGRYRDSVRGFLKGDGGVHTFVDMVNGDFRAFSDQGGPQRSIDFVTAHDGFTLMDLVSYNGKVNDGPPPFGPSDGGNDSNLSWDSGGDAALRRARVRSFLAVLATSRGVPMIVSGDEYGRTQNGNNNPWSLDTVGIWNNWAQAGSSTPHRLPVDPSDPSLPGYHDNFGEAPGSVNTVLTFAAAMGRLRRDHQALRQRSYGGDDGVAYAFTAPGGGDIGENDRAVAWRIDGSAVGDHDLLVLVNMQNHPVTYAVPQSDSGWRRVADTSPDAEADGNAWSLEQGTPVEGSYTVAGWAVVILVEA